MPAPSPTAREILSRPWSLPVALTAKFALIQRPVSINPGLITFPTLADLARGLHRRRGKRSLTLLNAALPIEGEAKARQGVAVWAVDQFGDSTEYLGWAWLDGGQRHQLADALEAQQPQEARHREAA